MCVCVCVNQCCCVVHTLLLINYCNVQAIRICLCRLLYTMIIPTTYYNNYSLYSVALMVRMSVSCCGILQGKKSLILLQKLTTEVQYNITLNFTHLVIHFIVTGAQACVLAFSTIDRESFEAIESWKHKVCVQLCVFASVRDKLLGEPERAPH